MHNGPLWKGILVPVKETSGKICYALVLGVQHVITDAFTNYVLIADLVKRINQFSQANATKIDDQLKNCRYNLDTNFPSCPSIQHSDASFMSTMETVLSQTSDMIALNIFDRQNMIHKLTKMRDRGNTDIKLSFIRKQLNVETTLKLIRCCQHNNTTMHQAVVTAFNSSLFRIFKSHFSNDKPTKVSYRNCVNLRRYYEQSDKNILGCHVSYQDQTVIVKKDDINKFWEISAKDKDILHHDLTNKTPLHIISSLPHFINFMRINYIFEKMSWPNLLDSYYVTSNMGDISHFFQDNTEQDVPFKIVDALRVGSGELGGQLSTLIFHTFQGQLELTCDCYHNKLGPEIVEEILDATVDILLKVADSSRFLTDDIIIKGTDPSSLNFRPLKF